MSFCAYFFSKLHQCNNHYGIQEYDSNKDSVNASLFSGGPTAKDYT